MSFVVSEGTLRGLSRPELPPVAQIKLVDGVAQHYHEIWRSQPAVRTVTSFLGRNIAQLGLHTFARRSDTERERLTDHPLAVLLGRPNGWTTTYRALDALVQDYAIFDVAYWQKLAAADGRLALVRLPPPMVTPKGENWLYPEKFELAGSKGKKEIPADQVVFFRGYNPMSNATGVSPLESLRVILAEEYEASRMRESVLRNGARLSGYLERPRDAKDWSGKARERFRESWRSQYSGGGPQAGGTPILEDGMTFRPVAQTAKDLQYVEGRKLTREEVASAYFIPPPMVGILDHATFSNITEQHKMLYQDTLGPWLTMIAQEIALQLIPDLDAAAVDLYVEFNLAEKMRGNFEERADSTVKAVGSPWMTVNEARALDNRPPLDGGDELVRPLNVTQNGDQDPIPAEPDEGTDPAFVPAPTPDDDENDPEDE
ncbi:phage portal protein [Skermania piniformis]|uniref:Phage portal protein n=1 Tax=Skermania pinensis TaxID=39122 RepID=A0ABX8SEJ4_9ACTN|nr:phage portal protein [Skermania piniformis]QXQ14850.1 phage portal protein [Skermania piniformis]